MPHSHVGFNSVSTDLSTYTFTGQGIGTAAADRVVMVFLTVRKAGVGPHSITSVTIGGVTATVYMAENVATNTLQLACAVALIPTGTTADIVITLNSAALRCLIDVFEATGLSSLVPYDTSFSTAVDPGNSALGVLADGLVIGAAATGNNTTTAWTGLTERADFVNATETNCVLSTASEEFVARQNGLTILANFGTSSGGNPVGLWLSWRYGSVAYEDAYLIPTGDGHLADWAATGAASVWEAVDDPVGSPDEDTTYAGESVANGNHYFTYASPAIPASSVIHRVRTFVRYKMVGSSWTHVANLRVGGTNYSSTTSSVTETTYGDRIQTWHDNPKTAAAWTLDEVNGVDPTNSLQEIGHEIGTNTTAGDEARITQTYAIVTYTPPAPPGGGGGTVPVIQNQYQRRRAA